MTGGCTIPQISAGTSMDGDSSATTTTGRRRMRKTEIAVRALTSAATGSAAAVMGTNHQLKMVPGAANGTTVVPYSAKYHFTSAFVFFVVANAVSAVYCAASFIILLLSNIPSGNGNGDAGLRMAVNVGDQLVMALSWSAASAAAAVVYVGYRGNSKTKWAKVCDSFERFCDKASAAIAVGFFGALCLVFVALFSGYSLFSRAHGNARA